MGWMPPVVLEEAGGDEVVMWLWLGPRWGPKEVHWQYHR